MGPFLRAFEVTDNLRLVRSENGLARTAVPQGDSNGAMRTVIWICVLFAAWCPLRAGADPSIPLSPERFGVLVDGHELPFPYSSSRPLDQYDETVERVVFAVHGVGANAEMYLDRGLDTAALVPGAFERTLVVAPQFLTVDDYGDLIPPGILYWGGGRFWGGLSSTNSGLPATVSSFTVLEQMLMQVADPLFFPNVRTIVIVGHSGGGQLVNRFAASNQFEQTIAAALGIHMRYVVMNPSSYVYFNAERAIPGTTDRFDVPSPEIIRTCSSYNRYGYGLEDLWSPYLSAVGAEAIREQYPGRNVIYLLGAEDNDPNGGGLARSCPAMLQGQHRLERGIIYFNYLQHYFGDVILENQTIEIVPGVGHNGRAMMKSDIGVRHLFDYDRTAGIKYVDARAPAGEDGRSWGRAFQQLSDILPFARAGDEIRVAAGIYRPKPPRDASDPRTASFVLRPGIQLKGGYAGLGSPDPDARDFDLFETVLSGDLGADDSPGGTTDENCYQVITEAGADAQTLLEGFTITGGNADSSVSPYHRGGGFYCRGDSPTVRHCRFVRNQAQLGGAVYNRGGANGTFSHCLFEENRAILSGDGGAVYNHSSDPVFEDCTFRRNSADDDAGAVRNASGSNPELRRCTFHGNTTADNGGAIYSLGGAPLIDACLFVGNHAEDNGGALYQEAQANPVVTNCLFNANSCLQYGGAVFAHASNPVLLNCTLLRNTAAWQGGGLFSRQESRPVLANCLFWQNQVGANTDEAAQIAGDGPNIRYSFISGWTGQLGDATSFTAPDPLFADSSGPDQIAGTPDDDLRLTSASPCVDTGVLLDQVRVDFEGQPRGFDGCPDRAGDGHDYDIGYDEYSGLDVP